MTRTALALSLLLACPALAFAQGQPTRPASRSATGFRYSLGVDAGFVAVDYNNPFILGATSWSLGIDAFVGKGIGRVHLATGPTSFSLGYRLQLHAVGDGLLQMHEIAVGARRGNLRCLLGGGVAVAHPYASPLDMFVGGVVDGEVGYVIGSTGLFVALDFGVEIFHNDIDRAGVTIGYTNF